MSARESCVIILEMARGEEAGDAFAFRPGVQQYLFRRADGSFQAATLEWTPAMLEALEALEQPYPERNTVQRLGETLRAFLERLGWQKEEAHLLEALQRGLPVQIIFRFAAAELYALPWELVTIRATGQHLGELPGCVLKYEWPGASAVSSRSGPPAPGGRLLFAWSAAGGAVPAAEQLQYVRQACERAGLEFDEQRDVVPHVSRDKLAEALTIPGPAVTVLHLLCHGSRSASGETAGALWDGPRGGVELVDGGALRQVLAPYIGSLRLVVLCACQSGGAGGLRNHLGSLAQSLHRIGLTAVVASRLPLTVRGAVKLVETLYGQLLDELSSLETAVAAARERLARTASQLDWAALQLYSRAVDGADTRPIIFRPYRGLLAFRSVDSRFFFGRDALTQELLGRVQAAHEDHASRFQLVVGASGSGKSSLVLSGLLSRLPTRSWDVVVLRPGESRQQAPAGLREDARLPPMLVLLWRRLHMLWAPAQQVPSRLDRAEVLAEAQRLRDARPEQRLMLVVDQLEELFTQVPDTAERQAFIRVLWELARERTLGVMVVCTLRVDFLDRCGDLVVDEQGRRLDSVAYSDIHRIFVSQLQAEHLKDVIEGPVRRVGLTLEEGLLESLRRDVEEEPGALPLLEYALDLLWERREGNRLTHRAYEAIGGVAGALTQAADALYDALSAEEQRQARRLLVELVDLRGEETRYTRRRAWVKPLRPSEPEALEAFNRALNRLLDSRLLVYEGDPEAGCVQVAHEALLLRWERLRKWVQEDREALLQLRELQAWARDWLAHAREADEGASYLLTGSRLGYALEVLRKRGTDMDAELRRFIDVSQQRQSQRQRRRRTARLVLVSGALVTAVLMGLLALDARLQEARAHQAEREANTLAQQARDFTTVSAARSVLEKDPTLAVLLLRGVGHTEGVPPPGWVMTAATALRHPLSTSILWGGDATITWVDFNPEGTFVAAASRDGTARVWPADGKGAPRVLSGHQAPLNQVAFSPDGRWLVTTSDDKTARVWRTDFTGVPLVLQGHTGAVTRAAFSPDSTRVLTASEDGTARLWRVEDSGVPLVLEGHARPVRAASFSPDGTLVVTGSQDGTARVWRVDGRRPPVVLSGHTDAVTSATFSPDGSRVVTASADKTARVWHPGSGKALVVLERGHTGGLTSALFSPDGRQIVTTSWDLEARIWSADGKGSPRVLRGHSSVIRGARFSSDGSRVLTFSNDATARIWSSTEDQDPLTLRGHSFGVTWATFSQDGRQVLTGSSDGSARVWQLDTEQDSRSLTGHRDSIWVVAYSPDGSHLATASHDGTVRIWSESAPPTVLGGFKAAVRSVTFSADSQRVLTADFSGAVMERRVDGGQPPRVLIQLGVWAFWAVYGPGEQWVAVASADNIVRLVSADGSGRVLRQFEGHTGRVRHVEVSRDGTRLATAAEDGTARIWSVNGSGAPLILSHEDWVRSAFFSPEGKRLLTTSGDGRAKVWAIEGPGSPRVLFTAPHPAAVRWAAWEPEGRRFVTACADHVARVWDMNGSGSPIFLMGHTDEVTSAVFSPDGRQLATSSVDRTVRLWRELDFQPAALLKRLYASSTACPLPSQRQQLLGERTAEANAVYIQCEQQYGRLPKESSAPPF